MQILTSWFRRECQLRTKTHKISLNSSQSVVHIAARLYCNYSALQAIFKTKELP